MPELAKIVKNLINIADSKIMTHTDEANVGERRAIVRTTMFLRGNTRYHKSAGDCAKHNISINSGLSP